jgi:hypothetical protein
VLISQFENDLFQPTGPTPPLHWGCRGSDHTLSINIKLHSFHTVVDNNYLINYELFQPTGPTPPLHWGCRGSDHTLSINIKLLSSHTVVDNNYLIAGVLISQFENDLFQPTGPTPPLHCGCRGSDLTLSIKINLHSVHTTQVCNLQIMCSNQRGPRLLSIGDIELHYYLG